MVKQISVITEDRPGKIMNVTKLLDDNNIKIKSITIDRGSQYGAIKLLVDKPNKAISIFKKKNISIKVNKVLVMKMQDSPGGILEISKALTKQKINLKDVYGFVTESKNTLLVIEVDDTEKVEKILKKKNIKILKNSTVYKI